MTRFECHTLRKCKEVLLIIYRTGRKHMNKNISNNKHQYGE